MKKFTKNQNVMYRQGDSFHPAKVIRYVPETDSYLISLRQKNGSVKERETLPERLYKPDDLQVRTVFAFSLLEDRVSALEKMVQKMHR
jgi:hypothetical protein